MAPSTPSLTKACLTVLLRTAVNTLPIPPNSSRDHVIALRQSMLEAIACLRPRDPWEAALAVRAMAAHHAVMESFRCAAQPDLPASLMLRHQGRAIQLSRLMDRTMQALSDRQQGPALPAEALPAEIQAALAAEPVPAPPVAAQAPPKAPAAPPAAAQPPARQQPAARPAAAPARGADHLPPELEAQLRRDIAAKAQAATPLLAA
jgi:hypothetical protein